MVLKGFIHTTFCIPHSVQHSTLETALLHFSNHIIISNYYCFNCFSSLCVRGLQDGAAVGLVPVVLHVVLLEEVPREALGRTLLDAEVREAPLLRLTLETDV